MNLSRAPSWLLAALAVALLAAATASAAPGRPTITSYDPAGGGAVGATVIIHGTGLANAAVRFAGVRATVTSSDATSIHAVVPERAIAGPVTVRTAGGAVEGPAYTVLAAKAALRIVYRGGSGLFVVHGDGTGGTRLTSDPTDSDPEWSGDGTRIVFVRTIADVPTIMAMNPNGSGVVALAAGDHPTWKPNAARLAFERDGAIWVMRADGQQQTQITHPAGNDVDPSWSPNSARIAFVRYSAAVDGENSDLVTVAPDGSDLRVVFAWFRHFGSETGHVRDPEWSPNGTELAFGMDEQGHVGLLRTGGIPAVTNVGGFPPLIRFRTYDATWKNCSRVVAHISFDFRDPFTPEGMYVLFPDASGLTRIGDGDQPSCWEP